MRHRQINRQRAQHEQQRDETGSRHRLVVWDYGPETKRVFQKKSRCERLMERVRIGTAENDSTVRRLAAKSVPHDQVNCRHHERIIVDCRGAASNQADTLYIWDKATPEAKVIIVFLLIFSIVVWSVMISKAIQMRRARKLNHYFNEEFRSQKKVLDIFDRKLHVEGCPLYEVYQTGCVQLDARLRGPTGERARQNVSLKKWSTSNARWKTPSPRNRSSWNPASSCCPSRRAARRSWDCSARSWA